MQTAAATAERQAEICRFIADHEETIKFQTARKNNPKAAMTTVYLAGQAIKQAQNSIAALRREAAYS